MDDEVTDLSWNKIGNNIYAQVKPSEGAFADGDKTKLDGIEAGADVTDTANVTAAGALMDSEVTNLAQVKAFVRLIMRQLHREQKPIQLNNLQLREPLLMVIKLSLMELKRELMSLIQQMLQQPGH